MPKPRKRAPRRARDAPARRPAAGSAAEATLLSLARELTALVRAAPTGREVVGETLRRLAAAYAPGEPLARQLVQAWLKSRGNKTAALALAWAREQVRLALEEALDARHATGAFAGVPPATRAWLLLAACEALAHEPPGAVPDRIRALLELSGHAAARG